VVYFDVFDGSRYGRFLGRAALKLGELVLDNGALEQPMVHKLCVGCWLVGSSARPTLALLHSLALEPRHDGSKTDEDLQHAATLIGAHRLRARQAAPRSRPLVCNLPDVCAGGLGTIEVCAQLSLPEVIPDAHAHVASKRLSFIEQYNALRRNAEWTYRLLHSFNNQAEQVKNTLQWAVMSRTWVLLKLNLGLLLLCLLVPSRIIALLVCLWLFTEKFRPHGRETAGHARPGR
jgi:hypothetical protein